MPSTRSLDVVIPVYEEMDVLPELFAQLHAKFARPLLVNHNLSSVRFIFVDDGSLDGTAEFISEKIRQGSSTTLLRLSRNFGHQAAVAAGLDHASASLIAVIDADLQDPPELILDMVQRIDEGFDIVFGQKKSRKDAFYKTIPYWLFYRLCSMLAEVDMPVDAGDFCVMTHDVVAVLKQLPEKLRFQRGLRSWIGFRQSAFLYDRPGRNRGVSKYTWSKLYALATDGIASLSTRPLRITQLFAFVSAIFTMGIVVYSAMVYVRTSRSDSQTIWFLTTQCLIAFASSLQLLCLYVLSAYISRMYLEVKSRPTYIIRDIVAAPAGS